jgi:hypothetical protein
MNAPQPSPMTTTILAAGAYVPEEGYGSMDLSMPQYKNENSANMVAPSPGSSASFTKASNRVDVDPVKAAKEREKAQAKAAADAARKRATLETMAARKAERLQYSKK